VQADAIQTREDDEEARFRNRGVNLTYRSYLQDSEILTKGDFKGVFAGGPDQLPQVSIEKRYADRVKMKIGDVVTFDVQGLELKAQVSSFRQVRWTSFQPNFFILFPTGVLEEAPQIFLTSVAGAVPGKVKEFQSKISGELKNVSIIDVTSTVANSLKYIDQMSLALQFMAWLAVVVGLFVFVVLLNTQIKERLVEMNLLQILGTSPGQVLKIVSSHFILLLVTSVLFGVVAGLLMAWVMISFFFDLTTVYDTRYLFLLVAVLVPVCALALKIGLRPLQKLNPMDLIRQI
jgi:putative ABC transport system permease protein